MTRQILRFFVFTAILTILLSFRWLSVIPLLAQADCGFAERFDYPVDTSLYQLSQEFGAPSPRHQGRYHTGEDWYGARDSTYGQPVRAAGAGRVTYSFPLGWGRDGGVVIIEHIFPDGMIVYTQYGHMIETDTVKFPQKLSCVEAGQIIGVVGDVRPAPHVHFEVRVANPDTPGPGYSWENPYEAGWLDPGKFVINRQAWLHRAYRWHIALGSSPVAELSGPEVAPFVLNDNSILYIDENALKRATADGRVLWRAGLERDVVSITGFGGRPLLTYADGTMQHVSIDGAFEESWRVEASFAGAPFPAGNWLIFPTTDQALVALGADRREILWRLEEVPGFLRWQLAGDENQFLIGLITEDHQILTISQSGQLIDRAVLRDVGSLAAAPGGLVAYTRGGLWQIDLAGRWSPLLESPPRGGGSGAAFVSEDGRIALFDGQRLYAYSAEGVLLWENGIEGISGLATLSQEGDKLLLTSTHGQLITADMNGQICGQVRIFGDDRAQKWHNLGTDGILRLAVADQIIGLDWAELNRGCGG